MTVLLFSYFVMFCFIIFLLFVMQIEKENRTKERISTHVQLRDPKEKILKSMRKGIIYKIKDKFIFLKNKLRKHYKVSGSTSEEEIQKKLLGAGNPLRMTVADYYIFNNITKVAIPLLVAAFAIFIKLNIAQLIAAVLISIIVSFRALDLYIELKTKERCKKALKELPDFLDILTISVEAGLGFDLALSKTIEKRNGILPSEFYMCLEEMRLGKTRKDALLGVKERLNFEEMASFVNSIIQSEKLGTGIVQTLRSKSEDERDKRKQRAEEQAMKMTIKILIPLVFLIFPSLFIVALGPAILQLMNGGFMK